MGPLGLLALLALLSVVAKCVYNAFLHPLSSFPGPRLAGTTRLYFLSFDLRGVSHWKVKALHDKYGPVLRIAPDELSYATSEAWQTIYGYSKKDGTGNFEKDGKFWSRNVNDSDDILSAEDHAHKRMRRLQNPAFSDRALRAQEAVFAGHIDKLVAQLRARALPSIPTDATHPSSGSGEDGVVDLNSWYNFATFDIVCDLAFGESFRCLDSGEWHWWLSAVFDIFQAATFLRACNRFPVPLNYLLFVFAIPRRLIKTRKAQFAMGTEQVTKRLAKDVERADFMQYLLRGEGDKGMTRAELDGAAQVFVAAGSETTATALAVATSFLCESPAALAELTAEVRGAFARESDITLQSTAALPYLGAVIDESLRIGPPGPGAFPRVVPDGGRVVCGRFVPGGCSVGVHHLSVSRSASNFADPDAFRPERWLSSHPRHGPYASDDRAAAQPFSHGPRNCIGKNLAMAEIRIILARMLWNFDMRLHPDCVGWLGRQKMFTTWHKTPLKVQLRCRQK
ncbi:hypothetical protein RB595_003818 [Gaeumannomyces hyphopodioides]